jgi:uncharacterized protein YbcV (DUF1398 family)
MLRRMVVLWVLIYGVKSLEKVILNNKETLIEGGAGRDEAGETSFPGRVGSTNMALGE